MRACVAAALCMVFWSTAAWAYRPFDSTDASVAAPGEFELELGPAGYLGTADQRFLTAPGAIFNLGLFPQWEAVLQGRQLVLIDGPANAHRLELVDTGVFLKGVLRRGSLQQREGPSVAAEFGPLLPTVNGDPGVGATIGAIVSQRWSAATVHVNGVISYTRAHNPDLFGGIILEGPYSWEMRPVAEVFVEREFDTLFAVSGLVGAIWRVSDGLSLDTAVRAASVEDQGLLEVRLGFTWATSLWEQE